MFEQAFKNIDDVLRKEAGCTTELDYTEQTSWLLFLKYLDALEQDKADEAALGRKKYAFLLDKPYRWEEWAAPKAPGNANLPIGVVKNSESANQEIGAPTPPIDQTKPRPAMTSLTS
jgi:hypothetical protein